MVGQIKKERKERKKERKRKKQKEENRRWKYNRTRGRRKIAVEN